MANAPKSYEIRFDTCALMMSKHDAPMTYIGTVQTDDGEVAVGFDDECETPQIVVETGKRVYKISIDALAKTAINA